MFSVKVADGHAQISQEKSPASSDSPIKPSTLSILWEKAILN